MELKADTLGVNHS